MPINGQTALVGVIGWPVRHSLSPAMHNAAAAALGLNLVYVPLPVTAPELAAAVRGLRALGFLGANVTIPHKQAVLPLLDEVDEAAQAIGAVNTIAVRSGRLWGANTDWSGFLADLQALGVDVAGKKALVLGAGGSARAVAYALASAGAAVRVLARRLAQAEQLAAALAPHLPLAQPILCRPLTKVAAETAADLVVNTTPLGMSPDEDGCVWPEGVPLPAGAFVYDLVYVPPRTRLLQMAATAQQPHANGLGMLLRQGAQAFQLWTGHEPDLGVMAAAVAEVGRSQAFCKSLTSKA
ncbi:MAG: shikimate dehydrogenase [Candidatus Promineifilaceae bacterium]